MRKFVCVLGLFFTFQMFGQTNSKLNPYTEEVILGSNKELQFIKFKESHRVSEAELAEFINIMVLNNSSNKVFISKTEKDEIGYIHIRYGIKNNGVELNGKVIIAHCLKGKLISLNGDLSEVKNVSNQFLLTEKAALKNALSKIKAKKYKWENKAEEAHMREALNQPGFSYYPTAKKVLFQKDNKFISAYVFNIYAEEPLYRANVIVDAVSGKILQEENLICTADVPATVLTKYSGTQTLTCDQNGPLYRLRETARGLGVETYNMKNTQTYSATDFTNATTSWTTINVDQVARDAHWGAEVTYDYYLNNHNRNSIDNAGYKLLSYVHYTVAYNNAFWDGTRMTYGDGNGTTFTPLTALDVCGHEVTHGLTSNSSQLVYSYESGALNESYSDIFGTLIENYGRPTNWNWKIGTDITPSGNGIRDMQNPALFSDPDTYLGTYWYTGAADNGGVHTNSGVSNYWFYLLSAGGTGTNDIASSYTVNSIGMASAAKIAFRALTVYYTPSTNYANARILSIQAAKDLFGTCSNEVIQTTNAWYAVGVGAAYSAAAINPNFNASNTNYCTLPANVSFNNTTANGLSYVWNFGDNTTSTATNVVHTYTANGTYTVQLTATGCVSNTATIVQPSYIIINAPALPTATGAAVCQGGSLLLSAAGGTLLNWYASPALTTVINTGNSYNTPTLSSNTTYYVVNTITNTPASGGILSNIGGGFLANPAQYLIFNVTQNSELISAVVYAQNTGNRVFELRNSSNTVLNSTTVNLAVGANTINLNYNLTVGTNYRLGLNGSSLADLYRSNTGVSYPYSIASCVTLTNSSAGTGAYYWFYNLKVKKADCVSPAVAVTATVNPLPVIAISVTNTDVCHVQGLVTLNATPSGGTFSGPGVTGSTFDPSIGTGTYAVVYNYTDSNGCSNSGSVSMNVSDCTGLTSANKNLQSLMIYPNPAKDVVIIKNGLTESKTTMCITDAAGRLIVSQTISSNEEKVNISQFANGIYLLNIKEGNSNIKTIKLVKE